MDVAASNIVKQKNETILNKNKCKALIMFGECDLQQESGANWDGYQLTWADGTILYQLKGENEGQRVKILRWYIHTTPRGVFH